MIPEWQAGATLNTRLIDKKTEDKWLGKVHLTGFYARYTLIPQHLTDPFELISGTDEPFETALEVLSEEQPVFGLNIESFQNRWEYFINGAKLKGSEWFNFDQLDIELHGLESVGPVSKTFLIWRIKRVRLDW